MTRSRLLIAVLFAWVVGSAFGVRFVRPSFDTTPEGVVFDDADTVRRLVRLRHRDRSDSPRETHDGYPGGTELHWTLPMDVVIRVLDRVVPRVHERARTYESGAAYAGPVLGLVAMLAFGLLALRLLGSADGLFALACYAMAAPLFWATRYGNGDHQSLQHAAAVVALLGVLCVRTGRGDGVLASLSGAALGLALWVSAESLVVSFAVTAVVVLDVLQRVRPLRVWRAFAVSCLVTVLCGCLAEGTLLHFEWDRISSFQWIQVAALAAFVGLAGVLRNPASAVTVVLSAVVVPFAVVPDLRAMFVEQSNALDAANRWARASVHEYRPLLVHQYGGIDLWAAIRTLSPVCVLLPLLFVALAVARRFALLLMSLALFGFSLLELKIAHLFAVVYPVLIVVGGRELLRLARLRGWSIAVSAGVVLAGFAWMAPIRGGEQSDEARQSLRELLQAVSKLEPGGRKPPDGAARSSVLAEWGLGAHLMYHADKPVVASGYHRNLAGIRDSYDVLLRPLSADTEKLLARRGVRWIVRAADPLFLIDAAKSFDGIEAFARIDPDQKLRYDSSVGRTLWGRLVAPLQDPRLQLVFESRQKTQFAELRIPVYKVYRVSYPDE